MQIVLLFTLAAVLISSSALPASAKKKATPHVKQCCEVREGLEARRDLSGHGRRDRRKCLRFVADKEMLRHGRRSGNLYLLRPDPRNPVGVMWIALNKKGIGIHGTNDPASIGHAASHGCIRLANWDIVRLATKIKPGDNVSIH